MLQHFRFKCFTDMFLHLNLTASWFGQKLLQGSITYITAGFSLCLHGCLPSVSACVKGWSRIKPVIITSSFHNPRRDYTTVSAWWVWHRLLRQPQAQGSQWVMSPPSRTSAPAQGPRKCMCSPCLVWQPPSSTSQEQKLISAALSLIPNNPSHQHITWFLYGELCKV